MTGRELAAKLRQELGLRPSEGAARWAAESGGFELLRKLEQPSPDGLKAEPWQLAELRKQLAEASSWARKQEYGGSVGPAGGPTWAAQYEAAGRLVTELRRLEVRLRRQSEGRELGKALAERYRAELRSQAERMKPEREQRKAAQEAAEELLYAGWEALREELQPQAQGPASQRSCEKPEPLPPAPAFPFGGLFRQLAQLEEAGLTLSGCAQLAERLTDDGGGSLLQGEELAESYGSCWEPPGYWRGRLGCLLVSQYGPEPYGSQEVELYLTEAEASEAFEAHWESDAEGLIELLEGPGICPLSREAAKAAALEQLKRYRQKPAEGSRASSPA